MGFSLEAVVLGFVADPLTTVLLFSRDLLQLAHQQTFLELCGSEEEVFWAQYSLL